MTIDAIVVPVARVEGAVRIGAHAEGRLLRPEDLAGDERFARGPAQLIDGAEPVVARFVPVGDGRGPDALRWSSLAEPALSSDAERARWARCRRGLTSLLPRVPICAVVGCREGSARFTPEVQQQAYDIGAAAARAGFVLLTGGLSGVMERAARGAREAGGATMGILPGTDKGDANPHVRWVLPSGIGIARNYLMALASDVMVAVNGGRGTLEEICYALDFERTVLSWGSWEMDGAETIGSLVEVERALDAHLTTALQAALGDAQQEGET